MLRLAFITLLLGLCATVRADLSKPAGDWDSVSVAPMKTSIYVGSVTLTTGAFKRDGERFTTTYEAKVRPWFFWGEHGDITITLSPAALEQLAKGERIEFTGEATNHKGKPRKVTGRAQRENAARGTIKVRIMADGIELVFNGEYVFTNALK